MSADGRNEALQTYPKTHAKSLFCLTDRDLEPLPVKEKRNPYVRRGPPMKLYFQGDLERAAVDKWGSLEAVEAEKQKRIEKKEKRALESPAKSSGADEAAAAHSQGQEQQEANQQLQNELASVTTEEGGLHPLVRERILVLRRKGADAPSAGKYVLYWMRTAVRDHDNPSLDVALFEARRRRLPLICASFLLGKSRHTHPTHRRFKFLLEGLREVQASLGDKGIPHLVFVEGVSQQKEGGSQMPGWQAVTAAAGGADLVITDLMPTPPYAQNLQDLAADSAGKADVWAVDSSCVVPMTISKSAFNKAYAFRNSTARLRKERLSGIPYTGTPIAATENQGALEAAASLPWQPIDLADSPDSVELLGRSDAFVGDVAGVDHMPGGQSAGYARWDAFRKSGLAQYAARRNNAMQRSGVSRLSAYHHFGMVSPFRVAREASRAGSPGASKFADEFLTWRELSYNFCHHNWRTLESLQVLPSWAQKTLAAHSGDERDVKSVHQLEVGETGDEMWDALQHQLNTTGELHNNVRMTWGKALLRWTPDPESALRMTSHLNNKFALDGCDPSSYGGILWCFGQFDGPKGEESTPIFGSLRNRPTSWLTRRFTAAKFRNLPLDEPAGPGPAAAGTDIRQLLTHVAPPSAPGSAVESIEAGEDATGKNPAVGQQREKATTPKSGGTGGKRPEASQASIEKFFAKRTRA